MNRNDFVNALFDNGEGLTLNQIQSIENRINSIDSDMKKKIDELLRTNDDILTLNEARDIIISNERDIFLKQMQSCSDLLELRSFLTDSTHSTVSDKQVYRMFYIK